MSELYPPESQRMDVVGHLEELRRRILVVLAVFVVLSIVLFSQGRLLLAMAQRPAVGLIKEFIFLTPTEVFVSYLKVVMLAAFLVSFPLLAFEGWAFLSPAFSAEARRHVWIWLAFAILCFFGGIAFSYLIVLPAALKFLLLFGEGLATPTISLAKYVSFFGALVLVGGCTFEIPVVMGLLAQVGIINAPMLRATRKYAVIVILVIAAIVTPTQDVVNLLLFAGPMMLLYEIGIWVAALQKKDK